MRATIGRRRVPESDRVSAHEHVDRLRDFGAGFTQVVGRVVGYTLNIRALIRHGDGE